jgi:hypothetical protein
LAVWLLVTGVLHFLPSLGFSHLADVLAGLAVVAGVLLLLGR